MTTRRAGCAAALAALIAGAFAACAESEAATESGSPAGALVVEKGEFIARILLTGELKAEDAVPMIAPNANIWPLPVRWAAEDGVEVAEGDLVVEFDSSQLTTNLEQLKVQGLEAESELISTMARVASEIDEAEFELERQKAEVAKARLDAEVPARLLADRDYENRQLALKRAELQLEGAERRLDNAQKAGKADIELSRIKLAKAINEIESAEAGIAKLTLRAPRDGILILSENPMEGRTVRPGDSVWPGMKVAEMPDLTSLAVEARLFDVDDGRVRPGQTVEAWLDAFPDRRYTGRVREVEEMANEAGRFSLRRFFNVKIALDKVDTDLMRPGMSVKLLIEDEPLADVLLVPRPALDRTAGEPRAATAGGGYVPVELGPCNALHCVARSGLEEGDELRGAAEAL